MKPTKDKGGAHPQVPAEDSPDAVEVKGTPGDADTQAENPSHSAAGTGQVNPGSEAGYGAETHPAGEDFSHRKPWRREIDARSGRAPADSASSDIPESSGKDSQ